MGSDVGDQVLEVADEVSADLIVIGLRRRSPVGKLLMGSVAQRILLGAECAVTDGEAEGLSRPGTTQKGPVLVDRALRHRLAPHRISNRR